MKLITDEQRTQLLANGRAAREARDAKIELDPTPVVKLWTPDAYCRWLLTEIDPLEPSLAYGLCDLGYGFPELGYVSLIELEDASHTLKYPVVQDPRFVADRPISAYAQVARTRGLIIT